MALSEAYTLFDEAADETLEWFRSEIATVRTGRVTPEAVNSVMVEHYGTRTPLNGVASVSSLDARTLVISPWDESAIPAIQKAITAASVSANPAVDGKVIRLAFPALTEEIRQQTIKQLHQKAEEARVRLRQSRDEALAEIKRQKSSGDLTEDDFYQGKKELDKRIAETNDTIEELTHTKEADVSAV